MLCFNNIKSADNPSCDKYIQVITSVEFLFPAQGISGQDIFNKITFELNILCIRIFSSFSDCSFFYSFC